MESTAGQRIREWRLFQKLSLQQMEELTGVRKTTLNNSEQPGASNPSFDTLSKLLVAFPDLSPDWLLNGTGSMLRDGRPLTRLPADPAPVKVEATPLAVVAESEQVKELKAQNEELRKQLQFMRDLMRSGVDLSKLQVAGSFKLDDAHAVVDEARPSMWKAA